MSLLLRGCWKLRVALFSFFFASSSGPAVVLAAPAGAGVTLWQFGEGRLLSGDTTLPLVPQGTHTAKDGSGTETTYLYQAVGQHAVPTVVGDVVTTQTVQSTGTRTLVVSASGWYEPFSVTTGAPTASQLAFIQCGFAAGDPGFGECIDGKPNGQTVLANSGLPTPVILAVGTGGEGKAKDNGAPTTASTDPASPSTVPSDSPSSSPSSASSSTSSTSSNSRISASIIAAAALSSIISTLFVFALVFWLCRRRRVRQAVFRDNLKATPFVLEQELPRSAASQSQSQSQTQAWTQAQRAQYQFGFMGPHSESSVSGAGSDSGRVEGRDNMFGFAFPAAARPAIRDDAHPYLHHAPGQGPRTANRTSTGTLSSIVVSEPEMAQRYLRYSTDKMPGARGSVLRDVGEDEQALPGYR